MIGIPLIESAVEWVQMWIEKGKGKFALSIAKMNKEATNLAHDHEETCVIGFAAPTEEDEEEQELTENDDF